MKNFRIFAVVLSVLLICSAFSFPGKRKNDKESKSVYAFGVATSFNDTLLYVTEIQKLDSVVLSGNGFLPKRDLYSYQLKNYMEYDLGKSDYTCMIYFSDKRKKVEKEIVKIKGKYTKQNKFTIVDIKSVNFSFKKPKD